MKNENEIINQFNTLLDQSNFIQKMIDHQQSYATSKNTKNYLVALNILFDVLYLINCLGFHVNKYKKINSSYPVNPENIATLFKPLVQESITQYLIYNPLVLAEDKTTENINSLTDTFITIINHRIEKIAKEQHLTVINTTEDNKND